MGSNKVLATVNGDVAHDAVDSGRPVKIGGKASDLNGGIPAAVAADDRVDGLFGLHGEQVVALKIGTDVLGENVFSIGVTGTVESTGPVVGAVNETAPATDTADSGLNGRLQRIAQRLTSLIAVFNIGAGTEAAAVRVTLPTDGTGKVNAAQSGTWTVQPGNTANTTAWKVDASSVAVPVTDNAGALSVDWNGTTPVTGSGTATGALRVELPTNGTGIVGLAAGTNAIGKLAANSGVDIGDVDVTTVGTITPGTGATALGKAIDSAVGATDTGVAALAKRLDTPATLTPASGDYVPLQVNSVGAQFVVSIPHLGLNGDPFTYTWKRHTASTAQTGTAIWTPGGGKKVVVTLVQIGVGGTTAGTLTLWFGASGDTTYTAGTDQPIFEHEFAPSATLKPGVIIGNGTGIVGMGAADEILRITTTNSLTQTIVVHGYEI